MLLSKIDRAISGVASRGGRGRPSDARTASEPSVEADAGVIGERFELIQGGFDQLVELAERFRAFEPLVEQMRQPLSAEFQARREEYVELIGLRGANRELTQRADGSAEEVRRLTAGLAEANTLNDELSARLAEQSSAVQDSRLEIDRLRSALAQAEARVEALELSGADAARRVRELDQDNAGLRAQVEQGEAQRAAGESARIQSVRDLSLAADENQALKRRMEEVAAELGLLSRNAATVEGQLAAERIRAAADAAEAQRAQRGLEAQLEAVRTDSAGVYARLDTATARATRLESLNAELAARLSDMQTAGHAGDRQVEDLRTALDRANERVRGLETEAEESRQRQTAMDAARLAAVDRADSLSKGSASQDKALARAEERAAKAQARLEEAGAEHERQVQGLTERLDAARVDLDSIRAEHAMMASALDAARRDRPGAQSGAPSGAATVRPIAG